MRTATGEYSTGCGVIFVDSLQSAYAEDPDCVGAIVYARDGVYFVRENEAPLLMLEMSLAAYSAIDELVKYQDKLRYVDIGVQ